MAKRTTYTTPEVTLEWVRVFGEAKNNTKYPKKRPFWEMDVVLDKNNEKHVQWADWVVSQYKEAHGSRPKSTHWNPIKQDKKDENLLRCTMKLNQFELSNGGKSGPPDVFAGEGIEGFIKGQPWPANIEIGNGSKGVVKFEIYAWGESDFGISLQVRALQVTEYLAYERDASASSYGFDTSEEGEQMAKEMQGGTLFSTEHDDASQGVVIGDSSDEDKLPWE